jgi:hypothetical protein
MELALDADQEAAMAVWDRDPIQLAVVLKEDKDKDDEDLGGSGFDCRPDP